MSYDVLKTIGVGAPFGTGSFAIATAVTQCSTLICTISDTEAALSSYTVSTTPSSLFSLFNWPGSITLGQGASLFTDSLPTTSISYVIGTSQNAPKVFSTLCPNASVAGLYVTCLAGDSVGNTNRAVTATLLQSGPVSGS